MGRENAKRTGRGTNQAYRVKKYLVYRYLGINIRKNSAAQRITRKLQENSFDLIHKSLHKHWG